jgi:4'-phosphopantetheinyl transferase
MQIRFLHADLKSPAPALGRDEVHVWTAPLTALEHAGRLEELLSPTEVERAARLKVERIREQFCAARGMLRALLAGYLNLSPCEVPITYEPSGKPILDASAPDWQFNLSHSESLAVYAFARGRRIGVDVERLRPIPNVEGIVERFFSSRERETLFALPPAQRQHAFFRAWVCKEAVLKATGQGVPALECCDVAVHPEEGPRVFRIGEDADAGRRWELAVWEPSPGYIGAVAVERNSRSEE